MESTCKEIGAFPTTTHADGSPLYTLLVIHDSSTGAVIADSVTIAEYLNITYPDTSKLLPPGTKTLQIAFDSAHNATLVLNPRSEANFRATKFEPHKSYTAPEGEECVEKWAKAKKGFDHAASWLDKSDGEFVMGDTIMFVDLVVGARFFWIWAILREEGRVWTDPNGDMHGGRWVTLLRNLEKYE